MIANDLLKRSVYPPTVPEEQPLIFDIKEAAIPALSLFYHEEQFEGPKLEVHAKFLYFGPNIHFLKDCLLIFFEVGIKVWNQTLYC